MVRAGLMGLEFYSPETGAWRQVKQNSEEVICRIFMIIFLFLYELV